MPRPHNDTETEAAAYHYPDARRTRIPTSAQTATAKFREVAPARLQYDPHLPPVLLSDSDARAEVLLETASRRALNAEELKELASLLANQQPWLEWAGKREAGSETEVAAPPLHIHEYVAAEAIIRVARRQDVPRNLFSDTEPTEGAALKAYQHETGWQNRVILGDSLQVMASLSARENLAGKVQMIYLDPPYGIKYASNFQSEVGKRDVKDKDEDLTREPEVVKAYRDTWTLGVHSYLAYLRDRLLAAKELLTDSGSIFVQISDENLHRVRLVMDEVFGVENFCVMVAVQKTGGLTQSLLPRTCDYLLWYAKNRVAIKSSSLYQKKSNGSESQYRYIEVSNGERRSVAAQELDDGLPANAKLFQPTSTESANPTFDFDFQGRSRTQRWKTNVIGLTRLSKAERIGVFGNTVRYVRYVDDFPVIPLTDVWDDTGGATDMVYVVQTATKVIERCMLMTTDPGDLVLDPTCGSGTTAYVAEQWGRRWITMDTSRVAVAIARQRLLTARYDYYTTKGDSPKDGFHYKTVPHVTLKSIAQNAALDPVFAKWEPVLAAKLDALNAALATVTPEQRDTLKQKYYVKEKRERRSVTDADKRRWLLPIAIPPPSSTAVNSPQGTAGVWREWEVPFDADPDYPEALTRTLTDYRAAWRGKMDEVNAIIAASAIQENLVDQPKIERGILRVSGPFTVEGVMPLESSFDAPAAPSPIVGEPDELETFAASPSSAQRTTPDAVNADAYLDRMIAYLRADGVRFPDNRVMTFARLEPLSGSLIQAEGTWGEGEQEKRVGVSFGPEIGSLTAKHVQECLRNAHRRGYDELVFAAFAFDASAQAIIQENSEDPDAEVKAHLAHIAPNTQMGDLLKTPKRGQTNLQLFTVFGSPRVTLRTLPDGEFQVQMEGVDIYDPVQSVILPTRADRVAAWFLDSDYDGQSFCITQAFFPDKSAWEKLAKALKGVVDEERFAALSGTLSLPFPAGEHGCAAVKVIDPRGNEVMRVVSLTTEQSGGVRYGK